MVLVEDAAGLGDVQVVVGPDVPRDLDHPVEVGPDPAVFGRLLGHALQAAELAFGLLLGALGHAGLFDLLAVLGDDALALVGLAELLLDGLELLAKDVLALVLLHALGDLAPDLVLERDLREGVLGPPDDLLQALLHVQRFQDLQLLFEREVGAVSGHVGQRPGLVDAPQELRDLRRPPKLEDVLHGGPVLASQLVRPGACLGWVELGFELHPHGVPGPGHPGADGGPVQAADDQGLRSAGRPPHLLDVGDRPDPGVPPVLGPRDQQEGVVGLVSCGNRRLRLVGLERDGHHHAGQNHPCGQGQQRKDLRIKLFSHVCLPSPHSDPFNRQPRATIPPQAQS